MKNFFRVPALLCLGLFLLFQAPSSSHAASERILAYDVTAVFDPAGTMEVTENITVQAAQDNIKRGIYRVLPIWWDRADNKRFKFEYTVKSLQRDGKPEPYRVSTTNSNVEIYAGSKDVILPPGRYSYSLTYTVSNHFSRFPEWDELYWNVTGNDWAFPIDKVRFRLYYKETPEAPLQPMPVRSIDVYTGRVGEQGKNVRVLQDNAIETIRPLRRGEGVTVAWTWPRGFLKDANEPLEYSVVKKLFVPRGLSFVLWGAPLLLAAYFCFVRSRMKSGPMPEIIPLFKVPENFTPGQLRFVVKRRYDDTSFAADMLNLIAKGAANLSEWKGKQILKRGPGTRKTTRLKRLQPGERAAVNGLFSQNDSVSITKTNREVIDKARESLRSSIRREKDTLLVPVTRHIVIGLLLAVLGPTIAALVLFPGGGPFFVAFISFFATIWISVLLLFTTNFISMITSFLTFLAVLPLLVFITPFYVAVGVMMYFMLPIAFVETGLPDGYCGVFCACLVIWAVCSVKLPRRTTEGRRRYALAQGLAMYLGTAERDRFAELYPPEESVEHFEELLPYALALDKGKTWANRFQQFLEETGETPEAFSDPSWNNVSSFRSGTTVAASSPVRSGGGSGGSGFSGSGSSGGGSSGRGGGGGGGGGW